MLTLIESISLAGDRKKQNDDTFGVATERAWVIDGATDLHDAPLTGWASDASWLASVLNDQLFGAHDYEIGIALFEAAAAANLGFHEWLRGRPYERWQSPLASVLIVDTTETGIAGADLGDCRVFALDAEQQVHIAGGVERGRDAEREAAAQQTDADKPLLQRTQTIDGLRQRRAATNVEGSNWAFGLDAECANHRREWSFTLTRPAHILLMTDGFAALTDQYDAYDAAGLVRAALDKGLQELGRELRAIEATDAGGAKHPRFKASDDATALLLRLT